MSRHRTLIAAGIFLALSFGASEVWAQSSGPGIGRAGGGQLKALNLTAQQQQQISQLRADMRSKTAPIRAQLEVKRAELRALWLAQSPNRAAIIAKHNELDGLRRQLRDARIDLRLDVLRVLTPQQRAQLQAALASRPARAKQWSQRAQGAKARRGGGGLRGF